MVPVSIGEKGGMPQMNVEVIPALGNKICAQRQGTVQLQCILNRNPYADLAFDQVVRFIDVIQLG